MAYFYDKLDKVAFKIDIDPSVEAIEKRGALDKAVDGASEMIKLSKTMLNEWEGQSTGNPSDKATIAYRDLIERSAELSKAVREMKFDANALRYWYHPDPKTREEHREDMEAYDKTIEELMRDYTKSSSKVKSIIGSIQLTTQYLNESSER